jgi:SNF2 family DNA or RNA helicase
LYFPQQTISGIHKHIRLDTTSSQIPPESEDLDQQEKMEAMRETPYGIMVSERQPVLLEGGALRPYQLDGLDWLKVNRLYVTLPVPEFLTISV